MNEFLYRSQRLLINLTLRFIYPWYLWLRGVRYTKPDMLSLHNLSFTIRPHTFDEYVVWETVHRQVYLPHPLPPLHTVIDLGAHIGDFTVFIAQKFPTAHVVACEPSEETLELLRKNCELNGVLSRVRIIPAAVMDKNGIVTLHEDPSNTGGHSIYKSFGNTTREVPAYTLEEIISRYTQGTVDLLKIDVEGAEYPILFSTSTRVFHTIHRIYLEFHDHFYESYRGEDLKKFLETMGYTVTLKPALFRGWFRPCGMLYAERPSPNS